MSFGIIPSAVLPTIRSSCSELRTSSNILINEAAIDAFILGIDQAAWEKVAGANQHGIRMPLRFDTPEEELNIISVLSLLNFLSGYREPLHRLTTRGAWSTILSLVLSAHLSSSAANSPLSTRGMLAATPASLASLAQITTHTEKDHPTMGPAVKVGEKDAEAWEILELLAGVLVETGGILRRAGKKDLGEWVKDALVETGGDVGSMIVKLATTFPAFCDAYTIDDKLVYILKKALFLLNAISLRFSSSSPSDDGPPGKPLSFPVPNVDDLPIFADNVIPTMLVHFNLLDLSHSTDPALSRGLVPPPSSASTLAPGVSLSTPSATRLRASALDVCAHIVARAHELARTHEDKKWLSGVREAELDGYLWSLAKEGELREVPRIVETGTVFY